MAGHSHAKTIKYRKNGQDAKRSKIFTKIQREIVIAVKASGADEKFNPKLRLVKQKARFYNMPNDKIADAIKRGSDSGTKSENYEECYYNVSLGGGVFILVKSLTDNKNRSASDVRGIAGRYGASIAESSTISFLFSNLGVIKYEAEKVEFEKIFEKGIESGAVDIFNSTIIQEGEDEDIVTDAIEIICEFKDFAQVKQSLEDSFGEAKIASLEWRPNNKVEVSDEVLEKALKLIDELEELDDTSAIYTNFETANDNTE